jgi:hypothetical protein
MVEDVKTQVSSGLLWAARVVYTHCWSWENDPNQIWLPALPLTTQVVLVGKATLICVYQAIVWIIFVSVLIVRPVEFVHSGFGGVWSSLTAILGIVFIAWVVFRLQFHWNRWTGEYTVVYREDAHWLRYIVPINNPTLSVSSRHIVAIAWVLLGVQLGARDRDLQFTTVERHVCSVIGVKDTLATIQCGNTRHVTRNAQVIAWTWSHRSPLVCTSYRGGLIGCDKPE